MEEWVTPTLLKGGIAVEPKWNGLRVIVQYDGERPLIYFEDSRDDRSKILPGVAKQVVEFGKRIGPFILDGELVDLDEDGKVLPRRTLSRFTGPVKPQDDSNVRIKAFHLLFAGGENFTAASWEKMRNALGRFVLAAKSKCLDLTEPIVVKNERDLARAIQGVSNISGSEGAMLKLVDSTYSLGGHTSSWAKLKLTRKTFAIISKKILKKPLTWSGEKWL